jgi:hypothetical protein
MVLTFATPFGLHRALSDWVKGTHSEVFEFNDVVRRVVGFVAVTPERLTHARTGFTIQVPGGEWPGAIVFPTEFALPRETFFLIGIADLRRSDPGWRMATTRDRELHAILFTHPVGAKGKHTVIEARAHGV